jgi:hypothetical protein
MTRTVTAVGRPLVVAVALALLVAWASGSTAQLLPVVAETTRHTLAPSRPISADAAERWWLSCTSSAPRSADVVARLVDICW